MNAAGIISISAAICLTLCHLGVLDCLDNFD